MLTDIRIPVDFLTHRKTRKLIKRLGHEAVCALIRLWCYAAQRRQDGRLAGLTHEDIALEADWSGDADEFVAVLMNDGQGVGFIDLVDGVLCLHEWAIHQPWIVGAPERSLKAAELAIKRHHKGDPAALEAAMAELHATHPACRMRAACDTSAPGVPQSCSLPNPIPTVTDTTPPERAGAHEGAGGGKGVVVDFQQPGNGSRDLDAGADAAGEAGQGTEGSAGAGGRRLAPPVAIAGWGVAVAAFRDVDKRGHLMLDAVRLDELRGVLMSLNIDGHKFAAEVKAIAEEHRERTGRKLEVTSPHYFQTAIARRLGTPPAPAASAPAALDDGMAKYVRTRKSAT